ncbi:bifunctional (p)ppGpp synthetase/guanosine-3',5'-bis(diphosphate) 3'-pyrophosphohydrolase, partial [Candidatus Kaiserbacteria bacterium]|nr:bifunctional (p)ppGpp synthetase/guanosine-3',5'-bis(diphosphate) 3'-pyrophosphohydrolase [Candidatus Kaiserbacteria bacterium]
MYTYKIEQATKAAALLHQDQLRKGEVALPYITHLVGVTMILRDYTDDEDTLVAALLHDTIEDTDYTLEELKADFGEKAALYVDTVSEHWYEGENKLPWLEVKKNYA